VLYFKKGFFMEHCFFKDEGYLDIVTKKFRQKRIILGSTDTILGLMGPLEPWAFEQLKEIKQRDSKPFIVLVSQHDQLKQMIDPAHFERVFQFVKNIWPGPVTCIVLLNPVYKPWLFEIQKTVAIRMPLHQGLCKIIDRCGPLFSTSVNLSGFPSAKTIDEVDPSIIKKVSLSILDESDSNVEQASTIIDLTGKEPQLMRQGAVPFCELIKKGLN
jgi:L-threonylcarbamoyladenylate synthase